MQTCDYHVRYAVSEVSEGLQLLADGANDPDPIRRADLIAAFRTLPDAEKKALMMRAWGFPDTTIAARLIGEGSQSVQGARLYARSFSHLRTAMNGKENGG